MASAALVVAPEDPKEKALLDYKKKLLEHGDVEKRLKESKRYVLAASSAIETT